MTEPSNVDTPPAETRHVPRRSSRFFVIGAFLWVVCFAVLGIAMIPGKRRLPAKPIEVTASQTNAEEGKSVKGVKLVPSKDGGFTVQTVTSGDDDNPWEAEGIADFSFTNCDGRTVSKQDLLGKPFVIGFVFTNCRGPCPNVTREMTELQNRYKEYDFNLVTLTVDPERDTPGTLLEYGKYQGADFDRWKFLTGDQTEIYQLIQHSFKMPVKEVVGADRIPGFEIIHSRNLMLVDATGRVVGKFDALNEEDLARLRKQLKRLAKPRANSENVGSEGEKP